MPPKPSLAGSQGETSSRDSPICFEADGFEIRRRGRGFPRRGRLIPYADVTHFAHSRWGFAVATIRGISLLRRSRFDSDEACAAAHAELRARIAQSPRGEAHLAEIDEVEGGSRRPHERGAVYGLIGLCLVAQLLQLRDPALTHIGSFMPSLFNQGEIWRVLTANFLHDTLVFPVHILLNAICLFSFGLLVERSIGRTRTVIVMCGSALGAMWASAAADYTEVIGASGVAAGLAGAVLCLEFNANRSLPVWSRIPRRVFVSALLVQALVDLLVPFVAGAAHAGGFAMGYLVTRSLIVSGRILPTPGVGARRIAAATLVAVVLAALAMLPLLQRDPGALERHGVRVLHMPDPSVRYDNEAAWRMLTESEISESGVQVAVLLALRAARRSDWRDPNVLDTLAEALFASGDVGGALEVIDQAIFLGRGHPYFVEQRRRFTGERDAKDRPAPPGEGWYREGPDSEEEVEPPGPRIEPAEPGESEWI